MCVFWLISFVVTTCISAFGSSPLVSLALSSFSYLTRVIVYFSYLFFSKFFFAFSFS